MTNREPSLEVAPTTVVQKLDKQPEQQHSVQCLAPPRHTQIGTVSLKPNSITLASSELAPNMFRASSELAPNKFGASSELAPNMFGSELVRSWFEAEIWPII